MHCRTCARHIVVSMGTHLIPAHCLLTIVSISAAAQVQERPRSKHLFHPVVMERRRSRTPLRRSYSSDGEGNWRPHSVFWSGVKGKGKSSGSKGKGQGKKGKEQGKKGKGKWQWEDSASESWRDPDHWAPHMYKTMLCSFNERGVCTRGDECTFAHGPDDLHLRGKRLTYHEKVEYLRGFRCQEEVNHISTPVIPRVWISFKGFFVWISLVWISGVQRKGNCLPLISRALFLSGM